MTNTGRKYPSAVSPAVHARMSAQPAGVSLFEMKPSARESSNESAAGMRAPGKIIVGWQADINRALKKGNACAIVSSANFTITPNSTVWGLPQHAPVAVAASKSARRAWTSRKC